MSGDRLYRDHLKRMVDLVLAVALLLMASPLFLVCAIGVRVLDGTPVLFVQTRTGRHGQPFKILKFRTMRVGGGGGSVTTFNDERVTRFGRFLRRKKLDELPQLINVVKGEMSLVGPRPDVPGYYDQLPLTAQELLFLRPGITGPASLVFRDEERVLALQDDPVAYNDTVIFPRKIEINLNYYRKCSLGFDLHILANTLLGRQ